MARSWLRLGGLLVLLAAVALGALSALRAYWRLRESNPVRRGADIAARSGCLSCHGPHGTKGLPDPSSGGGVPNPGSLKGYVPGWLGPDFLDLVRSDEELKQWIVEGRIDRLLASRLARHFLSGQRLQMPSYRSALSPDDTAAIVAYIHDLR